MRRASLSSPPVFVLAEQAGNRLTFSSDTGACAHVFVLEEGEWRMVHHHASPTANARRQVPPPPKNDLN